MTDVGAGAGAQSRAADTHLVLRPHEEDRAVVLDAAVRSWPPIQPLCLRWEFPLWHRDDALDPEALKTDVRKRRKEDEPKEEAWTVDRFVESFIDADPTPKAAVVIRAVEAGLSERKATNLLRGAEAVGKVLQHPRGPSDRLCYSRRRPGDAK